MKMVKTKQTPEEKKSKARWARILKVYGITEEQYGTLDTGYCPVCTRNWTDNVRPCIDHDHVSGEVRGLLCTYCNHYRVGRNRDSELVYRIAVYLTPPFTGFIVPKKQKKRKKKIVKKAIVTTRRPRSSRLLKSSG